MRGKPHSLKVAPAVKPVTVVPFPAAAAKVSRPARPTAAGPAGEAALAEASTDAAGPSAKVAVAGCASKLRVLADPTRLAVLESLIVGPKHVGTLQKQLGVEQSLLSHHLQTLRESGLVEAQRDGKAVLYRLTPGVVAGKGEGLDLGCCVLSFNESGG